MRHRHEIYFENCVNIFRDPYFASRRVGRALQNASADERISAQGRRTKNLSRTRPISTKNLSLFGFKLARASCVLVEKSHFISWSQPLDRALLFKLESKQLGGELVWWIHLSSHRLLCLFVHEIPTNSLSAIRAHISRRADRLETER